MNFSGTTIYLRSGSFTPLSDPAILPAMASVVLALPIFITSGLYRAIFRYSCLPAMVAVGRAMLLYGLAFAAILPSGVWMEYRARWA